ncbi:dehydrogenase [Cadophora sp. DSE1049]|nr:dehydrogenase [Cadophora sp. DSE1049]
MASARWRLLAHKTAAVTGGTTGIGRAITIEYLHEPHLHSLRAEAKTIWEEGKNDAQGSDASSAGELIEVAGDVTIPQSGTILVEKAVKRWGKLDVFVSNAGIFEPAEFLTLVHDLMARTMRINYDGAFFGCQAAARQMVAQGHGGSIIGISSISALVGGGLQTHYTPTKAAVLSLMQSMAISLGRHNIRCNALLPGTIKTQLSEMDMQNKVKKAYLEERIPLGRVGDTSDMAGPAVFLACEKVSGYVNGSQLLADGGMFVHLQ